MNSMQVKYKSLGLYTVAGSDLEGYHEIYLDPSPNVGYIVKSFIVGLARGNTGDEVWGKIATDKRIAATPAKEWNYGDDQEVAWAYCNFSANDRRAYQTAPFTGIIDPSHLLVNQCVVITDYNGLQTDRVEYIIQFEKVQINPAQRVMALLAQQSAE